MHIGLFFFQELNTVILNTCMYSHFMKGKRRSADIGWEDTGGVHGNSQADEISKSATDLPSERFPRMRESSGDVRWDRRLMDGRGELPGYPDPLYRRGWDSSGGTKPDETLEGDGAKKPPPLQSSSISHCLRFPLWRWLDGTEPKNFFSQGAVLTPLHKILIELPIYQLPIIPTTYRNQRITFSMWSPVQIRNGAGVEVGASGETLHRDGNLCYHPVETNVMNVPRNFAQNEYYFVNRVSAHEPTNPTWLLSHLLTPWDTSLWGRTWQSLENIRL